MNFAPCLEDSEPDNSQSRQPTISLVEYLIRTGGVPMHDPASAQAIIKKIHEIEGDDSPF